MNGENYIIRSLIICTDKIDKNEIGGPCSAYGGEERRIHCFGRET
jgi:hypothetical protein